MDTSIKKNFRKVSRVIARPFIFIIKLYQWVFSPFVGQHCRFYPTCSHYMIEAIEKHTLIIGVPLGFKRLLKCHPWHEGGYDPVSK